PKTATVGIPSARAAWTSPVSPPTASAESERMASASPMEFPVVSTDCAAVAISRARPRSRGPRRSTGRRPAAASLRARSAPWRPGDAARAHRRVGGPGKGGVPGGEAARTPPHPADPGIRAPLIAHANLVDTAKGQAPLASPTPDADVNAGAPNPPGQRVAERG